MKKNIFYQNGFSLLEIILSISLLGVLATALIGVLLYAQESAVLIGNRGRAVILVDEGLEAVKNMRDQSFALVTNGAHGLSTSGNQWSFSGVSDVVDSFFTRALNVSSVDTDTKEIVTSVAWQQNRQRTGTVDVSMRLTDWRRSNTFRVTEYYIAPGLFTGNTYNLTLNQALVTNYFAIVQGSDGIGGSTGDRGPDENYVAVTADFFGTGDLTVSSGASVVSLTRRNAVNSWVGVITIVECLNNCTQSGFRLLDVQRVTHAAISGTDTSAVAWGSLAQAMLMGGFNGAGCDTTQATVANTRVCHVRMYPSGTNTINWDRGVSIAGTTTSTVMVVEWGSEWTIRRVNATGSNGGDGANAASEYNTAAIASVTRDNTWVWGTGYTANTGIGEAAEGVLITLGNGVAQNASETTVAIGQELPRAKNFEVYALNHPDLRVDYRFKADGNSGDLVLDTTVDSAIVSRERMALMYNGSNGTATTYPRPMFSARYFNDTTVRLERRRSGEPWPAWIQGIDFSNITYPS